MYLLGFMLMYWEPRSHKNKHATQQPSDGSWDLVSTYNLVYDPTYPLFQQHKTKLPQSQFDPTISSYYVP